MTERSPERELADILPTHGLTLATAESCTGGLVGHRITAVAGSSAYFVGGVIAYSNEVKQSLLDVPAGILSEHGAVSRECALAMARGVRLRTGADIGVSTTGIAGPGGATPSKPVGLVYIACVTADREQCEEHRFHGTRLDNISRAAEAALSLVVHHLRGQTGGASVEGSHS